MTSVLDKSIAYKALQDFFINNKPMVYFGTGISCSLDIRFGMDALKKCLCDELPKLTLSKEHKQQWSEVVNALAQGKNLESAMDAIQDEQLSKNIITIAARFVSEVDREYSLKMFVGEAKWPAVNLFKKLVQSLPEIDPILHVATTNYDLLAEYALENSDIPYVNGFTGGISRHLDWAKCARNVNYYENVTYNKKKTSVPKTEKHIRLYKVHGSLNTFKKDNMVIENNAWMVDVPDIVERMMIIPGTLKHKQLHQNRSDLLGKYDTALEKHSAFLFIGFGFNDSQINNDSLRRKLKEHKCPGLIITRDSNPRIEALLGECVNLWLVCRDKKDEDTRIYNCKYPDGLSLPNEKLWNISEFTTTITGG